MDCDYDDKYVLMYGALEQDFDELQAEAAEVAALLQKAKENKLRLQTEIKFLKRRASMLRASMRIPDPYLTREAVGEGAQYIFGPSRASTGRLVLGGDFQSKALNSQSLNVSSRVPSNLISSSKHQDVVGWWQWKVFICARKTSLPSWLGLDEIKMKAGEVWCSQGCGPYIRIKLWCLDDQANCLP
ncbi:hypothetical protein GOP47_0021700 [Adiantum capillus-veneris]|uniref:Uncharacterized protein n=1 Tax=Adiantum capillus-veneris TaxID=13818 RepID=A0A9D4U8W8_ADICA|nr:hypothetical protein GOP47_0021700 [Adiantum capillus-veneris]